MEKKNKTIYCVYDLKNYEQVRFIGTSKEICQEFDISINTFKNAYYNNCKLFSRYKIEKTR